MNPPDEIRIASLELRAHVGVPAAERKKAQRLTVSLTMVPVHEFGAMDDDVAHHRLRGRGEGDSRAGRGAPSKVDRDAGRGNRPTRAR